MRNRSWTHVVWLSSVLSLLVVQALAAAPRPAATVSPATTIRLTPADSISAALARAQPGDTIALADGVYRQDVVTAHPGQPGAPITLTGSRNAVLAGASGGRIVQVFHSYITLTGFTVDGTAGGRRQDKGIYVIGQQPHTPLRGLRLLDLAVGNLGGECIRLRYFVQGAEVANNTIGPCGLKDFPGGAWGGGGKNGEGIYIGTAPEQRGANGAPDSSPDQSNGNWIHDNTINTRGNECVDIKEDATGNLVEGNRCTGQRDPNAAGFSSRGDATVFRFNTSRGNLGAGFRVGGDLASDGVRNVIYGNTIEQNRVGGVKVQRMPQGAICGNSGQTSTAGTYGSLFAPGQTCDPTELPSISGPDLIGPPGAAPPPPAGEATATPPIAPTSATTPVPEAPPSPTPNPPSAPDALVYSVSERVPSRIEAERATSLEGAFSITEQEGRDVLIAEGRGMLRTPPSEGARYALDVDDGVSDAFYVWVLGKGKSGDANSIWLRASGDAPIALHFDNTGEWEWVRSGRAISLDEGLTYLTLLPRERGTAIDQIILSSDPDYRPSSTSAHISGAERSGGTTRLRDLLGVQRRGVSPHPFPEPSSVYLPVVVQP